jgi:hypothetical protein
MLLYTSASHEDVKNLVKDIVTKVFRSFRYP